MKNSHAHGGEPLSASALIVIGLEMLGIAAIIWYACTAAVNAEHPATWFGERAIDARG
jgi:hypothetical protein